MVTLEKVETAEEMPENDTEPTEPELKEAAVEEKENEKHIEKEIAVEEKPAPKKEAVRRRSQKMLPRQSQKRGAGRRCHQRSRQECRNPNHQLQARRQYWTTLR